MDLDDGVLLAEPCVRETDRVAVLPVVMGRAGAGAPDEMRWPFPLGVAACVG